MFIDYGDYRVVELKNLREIVDETLQNIPQYSIQCSLCGVSNLTMVSFGMAELCYSSLMYRNKSWINTVDVCAVANYAGVHGAAHQILDSMLIV